MRVRTAAFAIVPVWVARHPLIARSHARLAAYVGLRIIAYEHSDTEWRSERDLALAISESTGLGAEVVRKYVRSFRAAGIVGGDGGDLVVLNDPPGSTEGATADQKWAAGGSESAQPSSLLEKVVRESADTSTLTLLGHEVPTEADWFEQFWQAYPRKVGKSGKGGARGAFSRAIKKADVRDIGAGLKRWVAYWAVEAEVEFIPHPSTWLNQERWNDQPPEPAGSTAPGMQALRRLATREARNQ